MNDDELSRIYTINDEIAYREIEGQILILRPDDNFLYTLNGSGRFIWLGIAKKKKLSSIIKSVSKEFGIPEDSARRDVMEFVKDLEGKGILSKKG
ncbi:MAG: PqqD family protein [Candidatus Dadabacteria bacterium]|nr:PqqD family protein [Candidatus Dadabacteria bacterium]